MSTLWVGKREEQGFFIGEKGTVSSVWYGRSPFLCTGGAQLSGQAGYP